MSILDRPLVRRSRLIGVLALSQIIGWGTTFDMPGVMGRHMAPDVGLTLSVSFAGLTAMMLIGGLAGPSIAALIERIGAARVLALGSLVMALGLAMLAEAFEPIGYFAAWTVIGVGGGLGLSMPAYASTVEREGAAARRTIGILMIFTGLSSTVFWPILEAATQAMGWRAAIWLMAGLNLFVCVPLHLFGLPKVLAVSADSPAPAGPEDALALTASQQRLAFVLISTFSVSCSFTTFGLAASFLELLRAAGASPETALWLGSIRPVLGISARAADLLVGGRTGPVLQGMIAVLLMAAGFALLGSGAIGLLAAFVVLYGLGAGIAAVTRAVLPLAFFPPDKFARLSGRLALFQSVANAIAPVVFMALVESGGASVAAAAGSALMVVALVAALWLKRLERGADVTTVAPLG
ncbi:MFS transporter [Oryzibacter oryziterrae]|uniref:MFS transporter n=1 Tax=Oryzibacter oryziterrae TaxID=2766474 RepID=UPI001F1F51F5|nr:MFS transporter [Oryzibacter oryziterrae]